MPDWKESHIPDIGITLVDLLAYSGDYLSYYQDAVATEAYLGTARERISVRRHARLVDYAMHEGCNARAWITIWTSDKVGLDPWQVYFITPYPNAPQDQILADTDLENVPSSSYEVFEPLLTGVGVTSSGQTFWLYPAHNEINFYTWGDCECCLAVDATSATLVDDWVALPPPPPGPPVPAVLPAATSDGAPPGTERTLKLTVGDVLIFEEVKGPKNGNPNDADPKHRQAVRLTKVTPAVDPLYHPYKDSFGEKYEQPILEIEWAYADALAFPLCISAQAPPPKCNCMEGVSVARGNVILVDHGGDTSQSLCEVPTQSTSEKCPSCCESPDMEIVPGCLRPELTSQPLTFSQPLPPPCSASDFMDRDPRQALPWMTLVSIPPGPACTGKATIAALPSLTTAEQADNAVHPLCQMAPLFSFDDLADPTSLAKKLFHPGSDTSVQFLLAQLSTSTKSQLSAWDGKGALPDSLRTALLADLAGMLESWQPRLDLLESGSDDRVFVVENDNQGFAHLRFGNGLLGRQPDAGAAFRADFRIGNGRSGNVGAETITYIVFRKGTLTGVTLKPRNPFAATGGQDAEPIEDVKMFAPHAFKAVLERAVTSDDYASLAGDNARRRKARAELEAMDPTICAQAFRPLQSAKAALRWSGSWYTAQVALDPEDSEDPGSALIEEITDYLAPFRRMGHDLLVGPARYVPLTLAVTVCVLPNYLRGHVEGAVLDALSNRRLPDGRLGFFHPDNLTFGDGIYVSRLLAAVQAVPGVQDVTINELERFEISEPAVDIDGEEVPANSVLELGPMEIAQLDNDPDFPEHGRLTLTLRGGR